MKLNLRQIGARKMEVRTDKWSFVIDLKEEFGGENSGPNPSELTAAAVASCEVLTGVYWAARRHGIELRDVEADVEWEYGEKPDRIDSIHVTIRNVAEQLSTEKILRAFRGVAKGCTITKTFQYQPKLTLNIE
jgi:putative redox protein